MFQKIKITVFFIQPASWSTDMSWSNYPDINLFLIDYSCCKLCNIWLLLFENNSRSYHYTGALLWRKNIVAVITQDRMIDDNLKRQIKNRTLCPCRLFRLLAIDEKYLSIYAPSLFNIHRVIIFPNFSRWTIFQLIIQVYI